MSPELAFANKVAALLKSHPARWQHPRAGNCTVRFDALDWEVWVGNGRGYVGVFNKSGIKDMSRGARWLIWRAYQEWRATEGDRRKNAAFAECLSDLESATQEPAA